MNKQSLNHTGKANKQIAQIVLLFAAIILLGISACSSSSDDGNDKPTTNIPVQAEAGTMQIKTIGQPVLLNGSASSGSDITYHWTLRSAPDGSAARITNFESIYPSFNVDLPGTYVAQLIVMDSVNGTSKDFVTVSVVDNPLEANNPLLIDHANLTVSCVTCHNGFDATGQPENHIESSTQCAACHGVTAWVPNITIDHNEIYGSCSTCHNGVRAIGKPANHIQTVEQCNVCHIPGTTFTTGFMPGVGIFSDDMPHPPIDGMMCIDCHNNVIEEGKPLDHVPAPDTCEDCHTITDWEALIFDTTPPEEEMDEDDMDEEEMHPEIGALMCIDCHNNVIEEGKEDDHIMTTDMCESCHTTMDWEPVVMVDHTQVIGECSSCHDNDIAMGKPPGHVETMDECNVCHSTDAWTPTLAGGGGGAGGGAGPTVDHSGFTMATVCMNCHNGTVAMGKPAIHVTTSSDCDVCHTTMTWLIQ